MRNYLARLGLHRGDENYVDKVPSALATLGENSARLRDDMLRVLLDDHRRKHYNRAHLQYEAIATTLEVLQVRTPEDHQWERRSREFAPVRPNELD